MAQKRAARHLGAEPSAFHPTKLAPAARGRGGHQRALRPKLQGAAHSKRRRPPRQTRGKPETKHGAENPGGICTGARLSPQSATDPEAGHGAPSPRESTSAKRHPANSSRKRLGDSISLLERKGGERAARCRSARSGSPFSVGRGRCPRRRSSRSCCWGRPLAGREARRWSARCRRRSSPVGRTELGSERSTAVVR